MNMNLNYNYLFSSLQTGNKNQMNSLQSMNFLSDYASIQNGSYGKALKAYYAKQPEGDKGNTGDATYDKEYNQSLGAVQRESSELAKSAEKLTQGGSKSLFKEDNRDAIYKAVKDFTEEYNDLVDTAGKSKVSSINRSMKNMVTMTNTFSNMLSKVGVEVDKDNKLSIDETTFKAADFKKIKSLFNGMTSYAGNVSDTASMMRTNAESEAKKANTYTANGGYGNNFSSGSIFNGYL